MKLLKHYFTEREEECQKLIDIFMRDGDSSLEATYRGQAEAYRICSRYYEIERDLIKFIEDMEIIMEFYKEIYMVGSDSMDYYKRYYAGLYFKLSMILEEIR